MALQIVKSGTWRYDDAVDKPVDIIGLDYDFWYEIAKADDQLDTGEQPEPLSPDGYLYYVRFRHAGEVFEPTWVDSSGTRTIEAAMAEAQDRLPGLISWK